MKLKRILSRMSMLLCIVCLMLTLQACNTADEAADSSDSIEIETQTAEDEEEVEPEVEEPIIEAETEPELEEESEAPEEPEESEEPEIEVEQSFVADLEVSNQTTHVIVVDGTGGVTATLTVHRLIDGVWTQELSCDAAVGKNGISDNKQEGDGMTPSGIYTLGQAFGIADDPGCTRDWLTLTEDYYWVDDGNSAYYNQLVNTSTVTKDWSSAEHLIDYSSYQYAIAIDYNTDCTPGDGSAIFLHCSTSSGVTAGCVAVSASDMISILQGLQDDTLIYIAE